MSLLSTIWNYFGLEKRSRAVPWLISIVIILLLSGLITAIVFLILRYAVRPRVKATIEDARLNGFTFATRQAGSGTVNSSLAYNISAAIRIHNPTGGKIELTKPLLAAFAFHDHRLSTVSVAGKGPKYKISKKEVHLIHTSGEVPSDVLTTALVDDFKKQNKTGAFKIDVRLSGEIAYVGLDISGNKRELGFSCNTTLQLAPPGPEVVVFHEVNCNPEPENIHFCRLIIDHVFSIYDFVQYVLV